MEAPITPRWTQALLAASSSPDGPLAQAAHRLAEAGVAVFPCMPAGKEPLTAHGFKDASTDPAQVAAWWRRFPDANIGLPTGAVNGVDVVDVDVHGTASGYPGIARAREAGLLESWAWCVRTPSGGLHVYFPHPVGVSSGRGSRLARMSTSAAMADTLSPRRRVSRSMGRYAATG